MLLFFYDVADNVQSKVQPFDGSQNHRVLGYHLMSEFDVSAVYSIKVNGMTNTEKTDVDLFKEHLPASERTNAFFSPTL